MRPVLLDIMLKGRFICQLKYNGTPFPMMVDGEVQPTYDGDDIKRFVFEKRPSLRGKNIRIEFCSQSISP